DVDAVPGLPGGLGRLARAHPGQPLAVRRPGRVVVQSEVRGQAFQPGAVALDGVELQVAVPLRDKGDLLTVWREGRVVVQRRVIGEAPALLGLHVSDVEGPRPRSDRRDDDGPPRYV